MKALENPGAAALMTQMGGASAGLPFYFFLDKDGKKIGDSLASVPFIVTARPGSRSPN